MKKVDIKKTVIAFILVAAVVAVAVGCSLFPDEEHVNVPALKTPKPVEYSMYKVARGTLVTGSSGIGTVTSIYYTRVAFQNSGGYVSRFNVNLGDEVQAGDVLVELDNNALALTLEEVEIDYEIEKLTYEDVCNHYPADSVFVRKAALELKKKENTYLSVKETYENTVLRAPVSGVVTYINTKYSGGTNPNVTVTAGETMVAIDTLDSKYIYVTFAKDLEALNNPAADPPEEFKVGTELTLSTISLDPEIPSVDFKGVVVSTTSIVEDTGIGYVSNSTYYCRMIDPPEGIMRGDSIKYTYIEAVSEDCLYIPISAYHTYEGKNFVYVLDKNNLKVEKYVEIGLENSTSAEVLSGLREGEKIVLN